MNAELNPYKSGLFCALALGAGSSFSLVLQRGTAVAAGPAPAKASIPWSQISAKAGADYR